jgi:catechol-2,3-dioxygenase
MRQIDKNKYVPGNAPSVFLTNILLAKVTSLGNCVYYVCEKKKLLEVSKGMYVIDENGNFLMELTKEKFEWFIKEGIWIVDYKVNGLPIFSRK